MLFFELVQLCIFEYFENVLQYFVLLIFFGICLNFSGYIFFMGCKCYEKIVDFVLNLQLEFRIYEDLCMMLEFNFVFFFRMNYLLLE